MTTRHYLSLFCFLFITAISAQEICDNGIDDDGDGLIDLNDTTDCICPLVSTVESLFPNYSFDDFLNDADCASNQTNGAPDGPGQANCIAGWEQASDATTDAWHLLTYNGNPPFWPGSIPEPIPSGLAVAGMFVGVSGIPDYREYLGSCLPDGPVQAGEEYRLNFQLGFGEVTGNGVDTLIYSPSPVSMSIYGIQDCENLRFMGNTCPENAGAVGWELITTFEVTGAVPSWEDVNVDFTPSASYGAIAVGGSCDPVDGPPGADFWRRYYFIDDLILNFRDTFENTTTVGSISVTGTDICDESANMIAQQFADATYQWYRNGVAIVGETTNEYYPELDADFPGMYSVLVTRSTGCGIAGPVDLIRPVVTNAFQDTVLACPDGTALITPVSQGTLVQEYLWDDGSTEESRLVDSPGTYMVTITSFCEQTIETIEVVDDVEPSYELVIEPAVYCPGDTVKMYFVTNWQLELVGFGPNLPINLEYGDTLSFVPMLPQDEVRVFVSGTCIGTEIDEYTLQPSQFFEEVEVGQLGCASPTTLAVPVYNGSAADFDFAWYDEDNNLVGTDSTLEISALGSYRLEVSVDDVDCTQEETFAVTFDEDDEVLNSVQLLVLTCEAPSGEITVLLNDPANTLLRWEDPAGNFLGDNDTLPVNTPGTYILTGYLIAPNSGDTVCVQTEDYTIPFQQDGSLITGAAVPILSCGSSNDEISLTVDNPGQTTFVWSDLQGNIFSSQTTTLAVDTPGVYLVQAFLISTDGDTICRQDDTYMVTFDESSSFLTETSIPELTCAANAGTFDLTSSDPANTRYRWTDAQGNFISDVEDLEVTGIGNYNLTAVLLDQAGDTSCTFQRDYVLDIVATIDYELNQQGEGCEGETRVNVDVTTPGDWNYTWAGPNTNESGEADSVLIREGIYSLTISNGGDCNRIIEFEVDTIANLTLSTEVIPRECPVSLSDTSIAGNVVFTVTGGEGPYVYDLNDNALTSMDLEIPAPAGIYRPRVIDARGCEVLAGEVEVAFPEVLQIEAGVDQRINLGDSVRLLVQTNGANIGVNSITWTPDDRLSCNNCPNPVAGPYESVLYVVTYETETGCFISDEVRVGVVPTGLVYIPNAFSPNFDGVNDRFELFPDISVAEVMEFRIFDRWGGQILEIKDQRNGPFAWDGKQNGQPAPTGAYVYMAKIRLLNGTEKEFQGTVNLVR